MPDLLPCPFCRGTDLVYRKDYAEDDPGRWYAIHVFCTDCHAHGRNNYPIGWCEDEQMAADAWNDREPSRLSPAGYVTDYVAANIERGKTKLVQISGKKTDLARIEVYVRNRRR